MIENFVSPIANWGWASRVAFVTYAAPIAIWGLGAAEGAIRSALHGVAAAFTKIARQDNLASKQVEHCAKNGLISLSCLSFTAISVIPLLGTGFGYYYISKQESNYREIKKAYLETYSEALEQQKETNLNEALNEIDESKEIDHQFLDKVSQKLIKQPSSVSINSARLDERKSQLDASLIHHYYGYSAAYVFFETTSVVTYKISIRVKRLALNLFNNGLIRKLVNQVVTAIFKEVEQCQESVDIYIGYSHRRF